MALETSTYIDSLVETNPVSGDQASTADDHIRLVKASIKRTFPNVAGAVNVSDAEFNYLVSATSSVQDQLDSLKDGKLDLSATAVYAQSAGGATSAVFATSATNATSAVFATSASAATNATSAVFATSATNATNAVNATNAQSAVYADSAGAATSAVRATSAIRANSAVFATSATNATSAVRASSAGSYDGDVSAGQIPDASNNGQGVVVLASTAVYQAGADTTRAITAAVAGRPRNKATDGYITLPGNIILQWFTETLAATNQTITFPQSFSGNAYSVVGQIINTGGGNTTNGLQIQSITSTQCTAIGLTGGTQTSAYFIAIGPG